MSTIDARRPSSTSWESYKEIRIDRRTTNLARREWAYVLCTNESKFGLRPESSRLKVWRIPSNGSRLQTFEVDRYQGGTLIIIFLSLLFSPRAAKIGENFVLIQEKARPHGARTVNIFGAAMASAIL